MLFVQEFRMIDAKQLAPLQDFIDRLLLRESNTNS